MSGYNLFVVEFWKNFEKDGILLTFEEAKLKANWNALTKPERDDFEKRAYHMGDKAIEAKIDEIYKMERATKEREMLNKKLTDDKINEFFAYTFDKDGKL